MIPKIHSSLIKILLYSIPVWIIMFIIQGIEESFIWLLLIFLCLAIATVLQKKYRGYSLTFFILTSVVVAMYHPGLLTNIGSFNLKKLIIPILMVIMFGMGASMRVSDFVGIVKMPKAVLIGLICQFSIMPFIGFGLAKLSNLPPEIAAGIILVGCSPSGLASNVMSYIAKANLALSLSLTMVATLLAPLITPLLMKLLAQSYVPIDFLAMLISISKIVIVPVIFGLIYNHYLGGRIKAVDKSLPLLSMIGIILVIAIITAAGRDALIDIGVLLIGIVITHNILGYILGFRLSRLFGLDKASSRTIALEVGMQNSGLASGIALEMGKVATMGLAPAVFGPFMNITGSILATFWRSKSE